MRGALILVAIVVGFLAGMEARSRVEASSVGGSALPATGSGGLVGASGPIALTGPVSITGAAGNPLTVHQTAGNAISINVTGATSGWGVQSVCSTGRAIYGSASSTGTGVYGEATSSGAGVVASNTSATGAGYALQITGDNTSPTRTLVRWTQQDTAPSSTANFAGDTYQHVGGAIRTASNANSAIYNSVGLQGVTGVTAATGATISNATVLTADVDYWAITGANGTKAVALPVGATGECHRIHNRVNSASLIVFPNPNENDTINGSAADASISMPAFTSAIFCLETNSTDWTTR
jgi:hypothetical protein